MPSSMGEGRPEPISLQAQHVPGPEGQGSNMVRVVRGDEMIVQSTSADFVRDALHFLKTSGVHPDTSVTIWGICSNVAFSGALKHV
jgi:hypothetical protein